MTDPVVRFLIVDDEKWVRSLIRNILPWRSHGFEPVGEASNGETALSRIQQYHPDILLTDVRMPGIDGLDLIERARERFPGLRIIVISGHDSFQYAQHAMNHGASGYILKPIEEADLLDVMCHTRDEILRERDEHARSAALTDGLARLREVVDWNERSSALPEPKERTDREIGDSRIAKALAIIHREYADQIGSSNVARRVFMNEAYFSSRFTNLVGKTFSAYVAEYRVGVATRLLRQPELRVKDVSVLAGFGSVSYFCRIFKEMTGVTPGVYRTIPTEDAG